MASAGSPDGTPGGIPGRTPGDTRGRTPGKAPHDTPGGTRAALVAAAVRTLREAGFAGASARQIARRAGCNQALVFYHFGSVNDLLVAALNDVSARRMSAYRGLLEGGGTLSDLVDSARTIFAEDLDSGHLAVLVEMINAAQSVPGIGGQVASCLAPWRELAEQAIGDALAASPAAGLVPARELAHAAVAGFLGLELLTSLDGDRSPALALFDRASTLAGLLDLAGAFLPPATGATGATGADPEDAGR